MTNYFKDNEDLKYYFDKGIEWEQLIELTEYGFDAPDGISNAQEGVEFYRDVLEMVGEFVANEIAPHAAEIDEQGVTLEGGDASFGPRQQSIFKQIKELELHSMCLPRELGGLNCPMIVYFIASEVFARGDVSVMAHHGFHGGIAMAMLNYSLLEGSSEVQQDPPKIVKTRFEKEIGEIAVGDAWGSMDITEPNAGSDMAALRSKGEQDDEGNWYVTGEKIFITSGHGKYHFVIARTEKIVDPNDPFGGLNGLSLFLVPIWEEEGGKKKWLATIDRVEEKLGHHGSVTATVSYDRTPAHLIGERGEGFKQMLTLMNGARVGVGFESIGLCEASHRLAQEYAAERPSMGKPIAQHEMIADYLDEMESDLQGLRALGMYGAFTEEMAQKGTIRLKYMPPSDEDEVSRLKRMVKKQKAQARKVTPLLKYLASEKAVEMSRRCLQIHGGNGYITEFGAEKLLRDALVMPIYEGTSQIQCLMAMKDALNGVMKNPQGFMRELALVQWLAMASKDPLERRVNQIRQLSLDVRRHLITRTAADKLKSLQDRPLTDWPRAFVKDWNPKRDFSYSMLHAERLTRLLADEVICEILLEQAQRHPEREAVLERYLERAEPRCRFLHDVITKSGERLLKTLDDSDDGEE